MIVAVSACLLGRNCKYDGGNNYSAELTEFLQEHDVVEICPEALVFPVPRPKIERCGDLILTETGEDVTMLCRMGVTEIVSILEAQNIDLVILKSRSPTCGVKQIYDGTFSGTLTDGQGLLAEALIKAGFRVMDAEDVLLYGIDGELQG